jgi:hypothetical protein
MDDEGYMGKYVKLTKTFMDDEGYMGKYVKLTKTFMDDEGYMGKYVKLTKTFILFKEYRFWCISWFISEISLGMH